MQSDNRPLSPHLQIYKPQWTWVPSILHRMTGVAITFGAVLLVVWLVAAAMGPAAYERVQAVVGSWLGTVVLVGFSWALVYHTFAGIRHILWDFGVGFDVPTAERGAKIVVFGSIVVTALIWFLACK